MQFFRLFGYIALLCAGIYLLYRNGFAVSKSIRAVLFVFRSGKDADRATLNACTGWVNHAGRFRESRTCEFNLEDRLSKGNAAVFLLDSQKQPLLKLNRQCPTGTTIFKKGRRYTLRWEFENATGSCELRWRETPVQLENSLRTEQDVKPQSVES